MVSVRWLVECLKQSRTVSEADYICFDNTADTDAAAAAAVLATNRCGPVTTVLLNCDRIGYS